MKPPLSAIPGRILPLFLIFFALCVAVSIAPGQRKSIKQYVHDVWNTGNGLPQNGADDILQTKDGYIWFATQEGLARFDGVEFSVFTRANTPAMPRSWVVALLEDSSGGIWLRPQGTAPGLVRYANGVFTSYLVADGLPSDQVNSWVSAPDGGVWLGTSRGIAYWKDGVFTKYSVANGLPSDTVVAVGLDRRNILWASTRRGLVRFTNGKFERLTGPGGIPDTVITPINKAMSIFEDSRGTVWMTSPGNVISYDAGRFRRYGIAQGLPDSVVYSITEDRRGTLWFGTRRGLGRFSNGTISPIQVSSDPAENNIREIREDREGSLWLRARKGIARYASGTIERFGEMEGLTSDLVQRLIIDREGSIWASTNGGGVDRFRDEKFVTYSSRVGISHDLINCVFEDKAGSLWIGTAGGGINRLKDGVVSVYNVKNGLPGNAVRTIGEDNEGNLWISTESGLCTFKNGSFTERLNADQVRNVNAGGGIVRRSGEVLIVSRDRVFAYVKGKLVPYQPIDSLYTSKDPVFAIFETRSGALWLTSDDSLYRHHDGKLTNMNVTYGIPSYGAMSVEEDAAGATWISLFGEGLYRFKDGAVTHVTPAQGLYDYNAYTFIEDKSGYVWISCNRGVYRVRKQDLDDVADGKKTSLTCTAYGTADGMESAECNSTGFPPAWRMHDGRIAFTTTKGVSIVNPQDIRVNTVPPPVVIDRFMVEGEQQNTHNPTDLIPGKVRFEFHYAGLSFVGAEKLRYKVQLVGLDKDWIDVGSRRDAYYTHLDPGEYTFKVKAANSDGIWNEAGTSVAFALQPHFYQTWWFLGLAALLFLTAGPAFYISRMRIMKERRAELEQQVQARTSELQKTLDNLKDTQKQLILSEKMASLGQLTAGIAHEIKNPLNFITNFAVLSHDLTKDLRKELAAERPRVDPKRAQEIEDLLNDLEQNVTKINEHGKRADSIVRGMLLHSRGKAGERQDTDLNALLTEYTNLAYHGMRAQDQSFNVKIETDLDPAIGKVNVVPQDLSRAFLNIVNNACYAANDKRKTSKNGFSPVVRVSARNLPHSVEIRIRDNGNGIPQSIREKVFNPFFTTKPAGAGTGLGLSLSYDIITQGHKGEIQIDTREGEFTEFVITLPKNPDTN